MSPNKLGTTYLLKLLLCCKMRHKCLSFIKKNKEFFKDLKRSNHDAVEHVEREIMGRRHTVADKIQDLQPELASFLWTSQKT